MKKIAISVEKPDEFSPLSEVFGRSPFFLVYNFINDYMEIIRNPFAIELGSAGIKSAKLIIENSIDIVIVKQIEANYFRFLTSSNISVYKCDVGSAYEAFMNFNEGKLDVLCSNNKEFYFGRNMNKTN